MIDIVTHGRRFHADEVTAIALLDILLEDEIVVTRTRDDETIAIADIVVDVGQLHSPEAMRFDHHHFDKDYELYGKSSAGLVWDYIKELQDSPLNLSGIDQLIKEVDEQDTGIKVQDRFHYCNIISQYNCQDTASEEQDYAFLDAVAVAKRILLSMLDAAQARFDQEVLAKTVPIIELGQLSIAVVPKEAGYIAKNLFIGLADLLVSYDEFDDEWTLLTIPIEANSFETECLILPTETSNEIFVHKAGFIGKYKTDQRGNIYCTIQIKGVSIESYTFSTNA